MDGVDVIDVVVGALLMPPVIAVLNRCHWPSQVKALVAFAACLLGALVVQWFRGPVDFADWRATAVGVTGAALVMHQVFWRPSGLVPAIERATTWGGPPRQRAGEHDDAPAAPVGPLDDATALQKGHQPHRAVPPPAGL